MKSSLLLSTVFTLCLPLASAYAALDAKSCISYDQANLDALSARVKAGDKSLFDKPTATPLVSAALTLLGNSIAQHRQDLASLGTDQLPVFKADFLKAFNAIPSASLGISDSDKISIAQQISAAKSYSDAQTALSNYADLLQKNGASYEELNPEDGIRVTTSQGSVSSTATLSFPLYQLAWVGDDNYQIDNISKELNQLTSLGSCDQIAAALGQSDAPSDFNGISLPIQAQITGNRCGIQASFPVMLPVPELKWGCDVKYLSYGSASDQERTQALQGVSNTLSTLSNALSKVQAGTFTETIDDFVLNGYNSK